MRSLRTRLILGIALVAIVPLGLALVLAAVLGENPLTVLESLVRGALLSPTSLGYSLYYATPLLFTGLSVAWALRAGLFNIGAEGQMAMGGVALAATGILVPNSANDAAVIPMTTAAARNANGACMPLRPAAAPTST